MIKGYRLGLIKQLTAIIAIVIGIYVAREQYQIIGELLLEKFDLSVKIAEILSFFIILIVVNLVVTAIGYFLNQIMDIMFLSFVDNFMGSLFGLAKGLLIIYIGLLLLNIIPVDALNLQLTQSYFAPKLMSFDTVIDETIQDLSE